MRCRDARIAEVRAALAAINPTFTHVDDATAATISSRWARARKSAGSRVPVTRVCGAYLNFTYEREIRSAAKAVGQLFGNMGRPAEPVPQVDP